MQPSGATLLSLAVGPFIAVALLIVGLSRARGRREPAVWTKLVVQIGLTAWVLVPAWLGARWFAASVGVTAAAGAVELVRLLGRVAPRQGPRLLAQGLGLAVLVTCAYALSQTRALGLGHLVFFYGAVELNDSLAFVVGRMLGKRRIVPRVSPNKTLEGLLAGLLAATACGAALSFLEPAWSRLECTALGFGLGVAGSAADLLASALKRRAGVKDFSDMLPGHGGVLDAYDSLLLVSPLWYALLIGTLGS